MNTGDNIQMDPTYRTNHTEKFSSKENSKQKNTVIRVICFGSVSNGDLYNVVNARKVSKAFKTYLNDKHVKEEVVEKSTDEVNEEIIRKINNFLRDISSTDEEQLLIMYYSGQCYFENDKPVKISKERISLSDIYIEIKKKFDQIKKSGYYVNFRVVFILDSIKERSKKLYINDLIKSYNNEIIKPSYNDYALICCPSFLDTEFDTPPFSNITEIFCERILSPNAQSRNLLNATHVMKEEIFKNNKKIFKNNITAEEYERIFETLGIKYGDKEKSKDLLINYVNNNFKILFCDSCSCGIVFKPQRDE